MRPGKNGLLSNALRVVISRPKCWKMHHRHSKFQIFPVGACPRTPLVPRGLWPRASSQPPTFVFQPPTSKLVETPVVLPNNRLSHLNCDASLSLQLHKIHCGTNIVFTSHLSGGWVGAKSRNFLLASSVWVFLLGLEFY